MNHWEILPEVETARRCYLCNGPFLGKHRLLIARDTSDTPVNLVAKVCLICVNELANKGA